MDKKMTKLYEKAGKKNIDKLYADVLSDVYSANNNMKEKKSG